MIFFYVYTCARERKDEATRGDGSWIDASCEVLICREWSVRTRFDFVPEIDVAYLFLE